MDKLATLGLVFLIACGDAPDRGQGMSDAGMVGVDSGAFDAGTIPRVDAGAAQCVNAAALCPVAEPQCQTRTCDPVLGCGAPTSIREGFACDDGNANTYDDMCESGACVGAVYACSVSNGGCGAATCVGHDPAPPTCQCSGRYNVTASEATDTATGLVWQRVASASMRPHASAVTYCTNLGGSWRLPTSAELQTIFTGYATPVPRVDVCAFPSSPSGVFWGVEPMGASGWFATLDFAGCCGAVPDVGTTYHFVRCVR